MRISTLLAAVAFAAAAVVALSSASADHHNEAKGLSIGDAMPAMDHELEKTDGSKTALSKNKGDKGTLVVFTCNHCPYVKMYQERIAKLGNEYKGKGIGVIAINPNDPAKYPDDGAEAMKERSKKMGMNYPYVVDRGSRLAKAFGASRTPEVYLFDANNKLVYHGTVDDSAKDASKVEKTFLKDALDATVAGKQVKMAETKAVGCGIKFYAAQ